MDQQTQMVVEITGQINNLFDKEHQDQRYEWENIDLTEFFTAYIRAGAFIFNRITGGNKNSLEFTHLANGLIVQYLLKDTDKVVE